MSQDFLAWQEQSYYVLLGVSHRASEEEIRKAYRRRALDCHPDRFEQESPESQMAHERFRALLEARDTLLDPLRREAYDQQQAILQQAHLDALASQYQVPVQAPRKPESTFRDTLHKAFEQAREQEHAQRADFVVDENGAQIYSRREAGDEDEAPERGVPRHSKKNAAAYYYAQGMRYAARGQYRRAFYALNNARSLDPELEIPAHIMNKIRTYAYYGRR